MRNTLEKIIHGAKKAFIGLATASQLYFPNYAHADGNTEEDLEEDPFAQPNDSINEYTNEELGEPSFDDDTQSPNQEVEQERQPQQRSNRSEWRPNNLSLVLEPLDDVTRVYDGEERTFSTYRVHFSAEGNVDTAVLEFGDLRRQRGEGFLDLPEFREGNRLPNDRYTLRHHGVAESSELVLLDYFSNDRTNPPPEEYNEIVLELLQPRGLEGTRYGIIARAINVIGQPDGTVDGNVRRVDSEDAVRGVSQIVEVPGDGYQPPEVIVTREIPDLRATLAVVNTSEVFASLQYNVTTTTGQPVENPEIRIFSNRGGAYLLLHEEGLIQNSGELTVARQQPDDNGNQRNYTVVLTACEEGTNYDAESYSLADLLPPGCIETSAIVRGEIENPDRRNIEEDDAIDQGFVAYSEVITNARRILTRLQAESNDRVHVRDMARVAALDNMPRWVLVSADQMFTYDLELGMFANGALFERGFSGRGSGLEYDVGLNVRLPANISVFTDMGFLHTLGESDVTSLSENLELTQVRKLDFDIGVGYSFDGLLFSLGFNYSDVNSQVEGLNRIGEGVLIENGQSIVRGLLGFEIPDSVEIYARIGRITSDESIADSGSSYRIDSGLNGMGIVRRLVPEDQLGDFLTNFNLGLGFSAEGYNLDVVSNLGEPVGRAQVQDNGHNLELSVTSSYGFELPDDVLGGSYLTLELGIPVYNRHISSQGYEHSPTFRQLDESQPLGSVLFSVGLSNGPDYGLLQRQTGSSNEVEGQRDYRVSNTENDAESNGGDSQ